MYIIIVNQCLNYTNFYSLFNMDHDIHRVAVCTKIYNILQTELYINFFQFVIL